jgi:hypothetical protein
VVTSDSGQTYNLTYADVQPGSGRFDIYDPNQLLNNGDDNNFLQSAASVTDGTMAIPATPGGQIAMPIFSMNPTTWGSTIAEMFCYLLSIVALACMAIMTILQNVGYMLLIAISPIMIGFMLIPALTHISTRFFLSLFSICLWPVGWVLSDLITQFILSNVVAASTSSSNPLINGIGLGFSFGGWILLALWVIASSFLAPIFVSRALVSGGTGIVQVIASAAGISSFVAMRSASVAASVSGGGGSISPQANSRMNNAPKFSRRPGYSKADAEE